MSSFQLKFSSLIVGLFLSSFLTLQAEELEAPFQEHLPLLPMEKDLQEKFYVTVPFSLGDASIEEAVQAFFKFLEEPDEVKNHIDLKIAPHHRRGDLGLKHRNPQENGEGDSKDYFHFHPHILDKYKDFLDSHPVVKDFMLKANPLWNQVHKTISHLLKTLEPTCPGVHERVFGGEEVHIVLRFLKYNWKKSGKYLARPHYDAGSFTLALAESGPGLRMGSHPGNLKPVVSEEGKAIFFLGGNFQKVLNVDHLSAGWHDVIQLDDSLIGSPFARWAIVAFIDGHGVQALSQSETHKWG
jgi:isopenicillin N synthase-like dioxygenase